MKEQRGKNSNNSRHIANIADTLLDYDDECTNIGTKDGSQAVNIAAIVQQELMKLLKGKMPADIKNQVNFSYIKDFAGMTSYHFAFTMFM